MTKRKMKDCGVAWIGQVPEGWRCSRMKYEVSVRDESRKYDPHADKYIGLENLISYGTAVYETESAYPEAIYACCRKDDVLFSKLRPYLAKCVLSPLNGFCTGEFVVFKEFAGDKRFLRYWLLSDAVLSQINASTYGAKMPRASEKFILNMPFLSPPLVEQRKIAAFLDGECGKIDVLRGKVEKQIAALEEYRKSVIAGAVTKGTKRGRKMKPSGVEWMPEVPSGWEMIRVGYLYDAVNERGNDQLPILSVSISSGVSDKQLDDEELDRKVNRSEDKSTYKHVAVGDLTYNQMRAWQGAFGTVTVEGMVSPAYVVCRPKSELNTRFIEYVLRTDAAMREIKRRSTGIVDFRLRLYWPEFKTLKIPYPSADEQREIAAYLDKKCATIDSMVAKCREELDRLAEYKKSLIYEYVTGKKEVA